MDVVKIRNKAVEYSLLLIVLAITILYAIKPWRAHFFTGLAEHWDTKLMGEWMAWNAHNILNGHFWAPDYHANFYYPHSYTLAFGELLWPQSFFYALLYGFSGNLFFSFNGTMLFFWALSGVAMFALLRSFSVSRATSYLGSFIYCLMPYRLAYYVEFNMVLVFILPLMILLLIRWLRDPSIKNALWFSGGFVISATSCIYFTIMAAIMMMFVFTAYVARNRSLLGNKKFYFSICVMVVGISIGCAAYLYPYFILRTQGGYERTVADYLKHHAQPMHYLNTNYAAFINKYISTPRCRFSETFLFPGTALAVLTSVYFLYGIFQYFKRRAYLRFSGLTGASKTCLWFFFWTIVLYHAVYGKVSWLDSFNHLLYWAAFALIGLYGISLFLPAETTEPRCFLAGLAASAVFCFFISLGPLITVGTDAIRIDLSRGPFADLSAFPLFGAVRGLTRFSIVILTYLVIAVCFMLDGFLRRKAKVIWIFPVLFGLLIYEAQDLRYDFADYTFMLKSKTIQKIQKLPEEYTLFMLPGGIREIDVNLLMCSIGSFPLLINGYSGFVPKYYDDYFYLEKTGWKVEEITSRLEEIWPPVYIVLDKGWLRLVEQGWSSPFPWAKFETLWQMIEEDQYTWFLLFRQRKEVFHVKEKIIRRVRTDVLRSHPVLSFMVRGTPAKDKHELTIFLNKQPVTGVPLSEDWKKHTILLPLNATGRLQGEEVEIKLHGQTSSCQIRQITFKAVKK
ncbi:hypothetical protein QUF75_00200 [Desulfococcaceae bacterium HSG7]|nr:hypothetical protein [Desulfococcaceae bacterium HSG7]